MINQAEFNGSKFHYDACCQNTAPGDQIWLRGPHRTKEEIMAVYPHMKYIGASYTTYHDGVKNEWPHLLHFFVHDAETARAYEESTKIEEEPVVISLDIIFNTPVAEIEAMLGKS